MSSALLLVSYAYAGPKKSKALKQAGKLVGNFKEREQARKLIKEALADSTIAGMPIVHYTAGRVEKEVYRHYYKMLSINRNDPKVDHREMADALMAAYTSFEKTLALDTVTDKKGKRGVTYSPQISEWISSVAPAIYNSGIAYLNKKAYYPQAYNAFMTYASLPDKYFYKPETETINDSIRANAYFYGGVMAYNAGEYVKAADAFELSRIAGYGKKEVLLNEMSCLSQIAKADESRRYETSSKVTSLAKEGLDRFGVEPPVFLQKYIAGLVLEQRLDSAVNVLDHVLDAGNADNPEIHAMKAAVLADKGDTDGAATEYKLAASYENASFTTLQKAAQHVAMVGLSMLEQTNGRNKTARQRIAKIKEEYLKPALSFAKRAEELQNDDEIVKNTIETVTYYLH